MKHEVYFNGDFGTINYDNGESYDFYIEDGEVQITDEDPEVFDAEEVKADISDWPSVADLLEEMEIETRLYARNPYAYYGVSAKDFY